MRARCARNYKCCIYAIEVLAALASVINVEHALANKMALSAIPVLASARAMMQEPSLLAWFNLVNQAILASARAMFRDSELNLISYQ
jgi:hypothetical protein